MKQDELLTALEKTLNLEAGALAPGKILEDLDGWDSMAVLEFQAIADEELGVQVDPDAITSCKTVADLCGLVKAGLE